MPRVSEESMRVSRAQTEVAIKLNELMEEQQLTEAEILQAVSMWQSSLLKWSIRAERVEDPDHEVEWPYLKNRLSG